MKKSGSYHHGDLRSGLVDAVRHLVEENGPDRFSVADACRIAGVSTAAPYRHFADRDAMLMAVAVEGIRRQRATMEGGLSGPGHGPGSDAAIVSIGMGYVSFACAEPGVFRLIFGLTRTHGDDPDMVAEGMQTYSVLLTQVAHRLGKAEIDADVRRLSFPLWAFVHGLSFLLTDEKVTALKLDVDLPDMMAETVRKLLAG